VAEPILVEVRRNGLAEAVHCVDAVAVRGREVIGAAGDPSLTCFMRSSSKPLQALPLVRVHDDLPDDELSLRCEQAIRNYDPCISCATHFLKLTVEQEIGQEVGQ